MFRTWASSYRRRQVNDKQEFLYLKTLSDSPLATTGLPLVIHMFSFQPRSLLDEALCVVYRSGVYIFYPFWILHFISYKAEHWDRYFIKSYWHAHSGRGNQLLFQWQRTLQTIISVLEGRWQDHSNHQIYGKNLSGKSKQILRGLEDGEHSRITDFALKPSAHVWPIEPVSLVPYRMCLPCSTICPWTFSECLLLAAPG